MFTRTQMMDDPRRNTREGGMIVHREYWAEILGELGLGVARAAVESIGFDRLHTALAEGDIHLNGLGIPLSTWDHYSRPYYHSNIARLALKARGDGMALSSATCLIKEGIRLVIERGQ